jgi:DNA recombination protein RmuC
VRKLGLHFGQANKDIEEILVSSRKITGRGEKIAAVDVSDGDAPATESVAPPARSAQPQRGPSQLPFTAFEEV